MAREANVHAASRASHESLADVWRRDRTRVPRVAVLRNTRGNSHVTTAWKRPSEGPCRPSFFSSSRAISSTKSKYYTRRSVACAGVRPSGHRSCGIWNERQHFDAAHWVATEPEEVAW